MVLKDYKMSSTRNQKLPNGDGDEDIESLMTDATVFKHGLDLMEGGGKPEKPDQRNPPRARARAREMEHTCREKDFLA